MAKLLFLLRMWRNMGRLKWYYRGCDANFRSTVNGILIMWWHRTNRLRPGYSHNIYWGIYRLPTCMVVCIRVHFDTRLKIDVIINRFEWTNRVAVDPVGLVSWITVRLTKYFGEVHKMIWVEEISLSSVKYKNIRRWCGRLV